MQFDWWTLGLQAINFVVLAWLLWRFLYHPVRQVVEKRRALAEQAFTEAAEAKGEAEAARKRFEASQAELAQERQRLMKELHDELARERQTVQAEARGEAERMLESARRGLAAEREAALTELRGEVAELATDLAAELLRKASADLPREAFLAALERRLDALPEDERTRLAQDLEVDGARLDVVTAAALTPDECRDWGRRLGARIGGTDAARFSVDPGIVGGAELRFPHTVLRLTWADQLHQARERMKRDDDAS